MPLVIADVNVAVLVIFAVASMGVYGIVLAGWASNSKYSLLGGLRSSAQMISYELAYGISLATVIMLADSMSLKEIVNLQAGYWLRLHPAVECLRDVPVRLDCVLGVGHCRASRRPTARRLIFPKRSRSSSPAITPNTAAWRLPCSSSPNTST